VKVVWRTDLNRLEWDAAVARLGGHPLQSMHWGEARKAAEQIDYQCLAATVDGEPVWLARVESRSVLPLGRVAWIPKGPAAAAQAAPDIQAAAFRKLKQSGFILVASNPWRPQTDLRIGRGARCPETVWIDLTANREELWINLDKQWRYGVRAAGRAGVRVEQSSREADCRVFFELCHSISRHKGFELPVSWSLMRNLLQEDPEAPVSSHLFLAWYAGQLASGAFILRCGRSIHYFWGATDRNFRRQRAGEAVQWAVIQWGKKLGCALYDLEGIDPRGNPGVAAFKQKMGGTIRRLTPVLATPFGVRGRVLQAVNFVARTGPIARRNVRAE